MNIVKQEAHYMERHGLTPYEFIEKVARTCYKSENCIKEGSAEKMVGALTRSKHYAMLEHHTLYLVMSERFMTDFIDDMVEEECPLSFFNLTYTGDINILSGSFRSFLDLFTYMEGMNDSVKQPWSPLVHLIDWLKAGYPLIFEGIKSYPLDAESYDVWDCKLLTRDDFVEQFRVFPSILRKHLTHTFKFITDRGVSHELVRHRVASFAQESTRYCNYSKDKHGNEITVIEPSFFEKGSEQYKIWEETCLACEKAYNRLVIKQLVNEVAFELATPQEARTVLPNSLKTEIIVTCTEEEWQHILNLRYHGTTGAPHPQILELMSLAYPVIIEKMEGRVK